MRLTVCTRDPLMARVVALAADAVLSLEPPVVMSHGELNATEIDGVTVVDVDAVDDLEHLPASLSDRSGIVLLVPCNDARSVLDGLARTPAALIMKPDGLLS